MTKAAKTYRRNARKFLARQEVVQRDAGDKLAAFWAGSVSASVARSAAAGKARIIKAKG